MLFARRLSQPPPTAASLVSDCLWIRLLMVDVQNIARPCCTRLKHWDSHWIWLYQLVHVHPPEFQHRMGDAKTPKLCKYLDSQATYSLENQLSPLKIMVGRRSCPLKWSHFQRTFLHFLEGVLVFIFTPSKTNMTGWKIHHMKMYFLLKMEIFQCHVIFHGCICHLTAISATMSHPANSMAFSGALQPSSAGAIDLQEKSSEALTVCRGFPKSEWIWSNWIATENTSFAPQNGGKKQGKSRVFHPKNGGKKQGKFQWKFCRLPNEPKKLWFKLIFVEEK